MKTLNELIEGYTLQLQQGEIQIAYRGILEFIGRLRADYIRKHPHYDVSGIYQGYMDMTYFSISTKSLKDKGLKIAIVYLHEQGAFEAWLSPRNRELAKRYKSILPGDGSGSAGMFHDSANPDAVLETILSSTPDFEDPSTLMEDIHRGVEGFLAATADLLKR